MSVYSRDPGSRRHEITLQTLTETTDVYGQRIQDWTNVATLRCAFEAADPGLSENADQVKGRRNGKIFTRYFGEFDEVSSRIMYKDRILYIDGKDNVGMRNREYVLDYHELIGPAAL
jgi:SPP1 family predicted phage head-tail adaptor